MREPRFDREDAADLQIDRVLRALDSAAPPAGLQERVLRNLQSREAAAFAANGAGSRSVLWPKAWRLAASAAVLLVGIGLVLLAGRTLRRGHAAPEMPQASSHRTPSPSAERVAQLVTAVAGSGVGAADRRSMPPGRIHLSVVNAAGQAMIEAATPAAEGSSQQMDEQALDDLHSPSFAAPELPLTPQERMVRLMLRRGEKHELAQLDPAESAGQRLRDRAAFSQFFDPPPSPQSLARRALELSLPATSAPASAPDKAATGVHDTSSSNTQPVPLVSSGDPQ